MSFQSVRPRCCCCRHRAQVADDADEFFDARSILSQDIRSIVRREKRASACQGSVELAGVCTPFHDFVSFLNCAVAVKHAMPISIVEFDFLQDLFHEPDDGWTLTAQKPGVKAQRRFIAGSPSVLVRCFMDFADVDLAVVLYNLLDLNTREQWDTSFKGFEVVQEDLQESDVVYFELPIPVVSNRDFVVYRRVEVKETAGGSNWMILQRSAEHIGKPEQRGHVRAENHIGGYIVRTSNGSTATQVCACTMSDPRGYVPNFVVNMLASKGLLEWCNSMQQACVRMQSSEDPGLHAKLGTFMDKYRNLV